MVDEGWMGVFFVIVPCWWLSEVMQEYKHKWFDKGYVLFYNLTMQRVWI